MTQALIDLPKDLKGLIEEQDGDELEFIISLNEIMPYKGQGLNDLIRYFEEAYYSGLITRNEFNSVFDLI